MGILNKGLWYVLGAMALGLAVSLAGTLYFRGEARTLRADLNAVQADLKGLESAYSALERQVRVRAAVDVKQSTVRAKVAQDVRAVRAKIQEEKENAPDHDKDSGPTASPAQLARLRRLTDAANDAIGTAGLVP